MVENNEKKYSLNDLRISIMPTGDPFEGHPDPATVYKYGRSLLNGEFKNNEYFTKKDGHAIYDLMEILYDCKGHAKQFDENLLNIYRYFLRTYRILNGSAGYHGEKKGLFNKLKAGAKATEEKMAAENILKAYNNGGFPMKVAAWAATHFYLLDICFNMDEITVFIPYDHAELYEVWNRYINEQKDVPAYVKKLFKMNAEGNVEFITGVPTVFANANKTPDDVPVEDNPFDQSSIINGDVISLVDDATPRVEVVENPKMVVEEEEKKEEKKSYSFGDLMNKKQTVPSGTNPKKSKASKADELVGKSVDEVQGEGQNPFEENNSKWNEWYPGLDRVTKVIRKCGFDVAYIASSNYPDLILAQVVNRNTGLVDKLWLVDPGMIYGDTFRIIPCDRPDASLVREVFVAPSQEKMVQKLLNGTMTMEDRKALKESLPKCITNVDAKNEKYCFLNRVDMSSLGGKMNFMPWRSLVINISNILNNMPKACRFRLVDVDGKKFKLICDGFVKCPYNVNIVDEDIHKEISRHGFVVDVDPEKYSENFGYVCYNQDCTPVMFDPYSLQKKEADTAAAD